ncbi:hypothetical protein [Oceanospirillum sediminis]|uniref:Universal stress protein B n=1 Tax=Oceanospirillum sediminis TaxID=2760088 RepID=A0A839ILS5_9GAMM|nr:hypothetical protein [Oceanospirillum sediminis]MBB1485276.1 hypothetical protein [Oceanospirillum sediminis]
MVTIALTVLLLLFSGTALCGLRFQAALRSLLTRIRQTDPEWFRQIDGEHFANQRELSSHQISLFNYIIQYRDQSHPAPFIKQKCQRIRILVRHTVRWLMAMFVWIFLTMPLAIML